VVEAAGLVEPARPEQRAGLGQRHEAAGDRMRPQGVDEQTWRRPVCQASGSPIPGLLDGLPDGGVVRAFAWVDAVAGHVVSRFGSGGVVEGQQIEPVGAGAVTDAKDTNACTSSAQLPAGRIVARIASSGTVCEHPISAHVVSLAAYGRRA
jgi:hypothetical protein